MLSFSRGSSDNVNFAGGSLFCNKNIYILMILLNYSSCQHPQMTSLANCISYQLILPLSKPPSGEPGSATMRCLFLRELVFNHSFYTIVLLTAHKRSASNNCRVLLTVRQRIRSICLAYILQKLSFFLFLQTNTQTQFFLKKKHSHVDTVLNKFLFFNNSIVI